ncbi:MAG: hypothetical protein KAT00_12270 [Planctomycetes bacterium]|nr:hypothetical protein [Planctomycetota bacterium]
MNGICETILAESGGWFQILVAVAFMVIYGLGGLAKVRNAQKEAEEEGHEPEHPDERPQRPPRYKPIGDQPATRRTTSQRARTLPYARDAGTGEPAETRPQPRQVHPVPRPASRPQTPQQPTPARVHRPASPSPPPVPQAQHGQRPHRRPVPVAQVEHAQVRPATSRPQPRPASRPAVRKVRRPKPAKPAKIAAPAKKAPQPVPVIPLEALSIASLREPDNLKMAIVFSEILGKPIALRDQLPGPIF